jgi:hypothetical protein
VQHLDGGAHAGEKAIFLKAAEYVEDMLRDDGDKEGEVANVNGSVTALRLAKEVISQHSQREQLNIQKCTYISSDQQERCVSYILVIVTKGDKVHAFYKKIL